MSSDDIQKKVKSKKLIHKNGKSLFSWQGFDWQGYGWWGFGWRGFGWRAHKLYVAINTANESNHNYELWIMNCELGIRNCELGIRN